MRIYTTEINGEQVEYVEIELCEGHFTSMPKSTWDELQARQSEGGLN